MESEDNLFVGILDPKDVRRNLLESSKSVILCMQHYRKIRDLQIEKEESKKKLKSDIKEIKILLTNLDKLFPKDVYKSPIPKKIKKVETVEEPDEVQDEVDEIHQQLAMIEQKLSGINR